MLAKNVASRVVGSSILAVLLVAAGVGVARGDRPTAPHLLPENTVAYVRIHNARDLVEKFRNTAMGRVLHDEQVRPFVSRLYGSVAEAFQRVGDQLGLTLSQLLAIPQGEVCAGLVAPESGPPALVVLVVVGDQLPSAQKVLEAVQADVERRTAPRTREECEGTQLTILQQGGGQNQRVVFFERDKTVGVVTNLELAKQLLSVWGGAKARTLADNRQFTAIMKRCVGTENERPELAYFADPIKLVKSITSGNVGAQVGLAMLQPLGLNDVQGVGGSLILGGEQFESIQHIHILLGSPRTGILEMLALSSGDVTPEPWAPNDVSAYMTVHWDFAKTYSELERLFDDFRGDGAWAQNVVGRLGKGLGVDVEKDLVGALEGRVTLATWMQKPARLNSQTTLIGVKLKDAEASRPVFEKIVALAGQEWAEQNYAGVKYYCIRQRRTPPNFNTEIMRLPDPSVAILGDYLILTDSSEFLQRAIATSKGSPPPLSEELDFKLIASKISRQVGGDKPSMISFGRPEETLRTFYDLATSDATRGRLAKQAERNPLLRMLHQAMSEHPLPPFSVLAKYFAPTGGLLTTDQIGIHSMGFTLKRD